MTPLVQSSYSASYTIDKKSSFLIVFKVISCVCACTFAYSFDEVVH